MRNQINQLDLFWSVPFRSFYISTYTLKVLRTAVLKMQSLSVTYIIFLYFFAVINHHFHSFCAHADQLSQHDFKISTNNITGAVTETQHATCKISTEELVANAQATVTRVLTGMCSAETVEKRFQQLESLLKREFDNINHKLDYLVMRKKNEISKTSHSTAIIDPRHDEIERLNGTIHYINMPLGTARVFAYFLRIDNFVEKTSRWESGRFERSSTFTVGPGGYAMYVKVTPRDEQGDVTFVNIGAGVTRGPFDSTLEWPFSLKHRIEILDHSMEADRQDLSSRISDPSLSRNSLPWRRPMILQGMNTDNPEGVGIGFPLSFILPDNNHERYSQSHMVQFQLLSHNLRYLKKHVQSEIIVNQTHSLETRENYMDINLTERMEKSVEKNVAHHQAIIKLSENLESVFSYQLLLQFVCSLLAICALL
ncbi:uncharacterized protein LOC105687781 isoform X2 [Athalia rosae]|nr:uncharacterized protein LOC105687781 isoform X2 [Athalia rosae]